MIGTLKKVIEEMEEGVYNFCDKDGNCVGCGKCCSALLPLSQKEIDDIKRYVKKHNIKQHNHTLGLPLSEPVSLDLTCPFLDNTKKCDKCDIYEIRPKICRTFQCNQPPSKVKENRDEFWKCRKATNMWDLLN